MSQTYKELSIVIGGEAGQGIQTIESLLVTMLKNEGYNVCATKEYMSRIRGGSNTTEIRVSPVHVSAYVERIDLLFALDEQVIDHVGKRIRPETIIIADTRLFKKQYAHRIINAPLSEMAKALGNPVYANTVAVGMLLGMLKIQKENFHKFLTKMFARKGDEVVQKNIQASDEGYVFGEHLAFLEGIDIDIAKATEVKDDLLLSGTDALGYGTVAAGCNFISSYPMSPGTTLLTFLAQHGEKYGIAVEQVEDEISAINMALGAWYAGARAVVTTSGGGFALMEEGVSLAGIIETPIVIHIAQRPGPATGLPTRTEQADLNLALYSGHGEFPRAIFAPGSLDELYVAAQHAFRIADRYQSPVFILTDQYVLDMIGTIDITELKTLPWKQEIVLTTKDYVRYAITDSGVSPRGIPGLGEGLVVVDSDEHTENGHITEDLDVRVQMMDKRMRKMEGMQNEALAPVVSGAVGGSIVIVGWGSTKGVIDEALMYCGGKNIRSIHFHQVYPLPKDMQHYFASASKIVVIENNFTGQFAQLLKLHDIVVNETILKYNGEPFSVEELIEKMRQL